MDRRPRILLIVLLVLGVLLLAAAGIVYVVSQQSQKPPKVEMPPSLDEVAEQYPELARIIENSKLDTVYKEFLVAYEDEGEEAALEMARERGILIKNEGKEYVRLTLILDTDDSEPLKGQLEDAGVVIVSAFRNQIEVAVPLDSVRQQLASDDPGAIFEQLTEMEHVVAVRLPARTSPNDVIEGEGVGVIDADAWHSAGITGAGLRIGVLDLGFEGYEDLLGTELPNEVTFKTFGWNFAEDAPMEQKVHGAACAEIIHEIAPDAELVFAMYDGSQAAFGEAVDWLVGQDVDIISHSAGGVVDPRNGTGWMSQLVDEVSSMGILWVNAAGNEALSHHRGVFTDVDGNGIHEFPSGHESLAAVGPGYIQVVLMWDEPWEGATEDYQLYVFDSAGELQGRSEWPQTGEHEHVPGELVQVYSGGDVVYAVVVAADADRAVTFDIFIRGGMVDYPTASYSVGAPGDAFSSLTVGAANWSDDSLAEYSSQGPTVDERLKPEISAPTGVSGASYGGLGMSFTGTSASCPHVAGAAALVWSAHSDFTRQDVVNFLLTNAIDRGPGGPDTGYGYGRLDLPEVVSPGPTSTPVPTAEPGSTATPIPTRAPVEPEPTATPVTDYVIPTQAPVPPTPPNGGGMALLAGVGILVIGLGCGGVLLLFVGLIGLIVLVRRGSRPRPAAYPGPYGPPPPSPVPPQPRAAPRETAQCPHCGAAVRPGARFCAACGNSIAQAHHCPHCGAPLKSGVRFCGRCGKPIQ